MPPELRFGNSTPDHRQDMHLAELSLSQKPSQEKLLCNELCIPENDMLAEKAASIGKMHCHVESMLIDNRAAPAQEVAQL